MYNDKKLFWARDYWLPRKTYHNPIFGPEKTLWGVESPIHII